MKTETFTASTLDECKKAKDRWLTAHKGVTIKKEYTPPEMQTPAGRFAPKAEGEAAYVTMCIEYEDSI